MTTELNLEQREAVETLRGPLCILAGPGSGKTATVTRRIANQVEKGVFSSSQILAVTFTDKAAKEMAARLQVLGVTGVRARTFHAEALSQLRQLSSNEKEIISSKVPLLKSLVQALPAPYKFTTARDIATEIEWAKNKRIKPGGYEDGLDGHQPPVPSDLMAGLYSAYERRKAKARLVDFEDLLEEAIRLLDDNPGAKGQLHERYLAFTVDEYQDVNLLQQALLERWVGSRRDLCVVGDDYQSIFGFTGATPQYLLGFSRRFPGCKVIQLTKNYRSTPEILRLANRLEPGMQGSSKVLEACSGSGPAPVFKEFAEGGDESTWVAQEARALNEKGVAWEQMAVLYRINGRSEEFENALSAASIPYQVADSPFLRRPAARAVLRKLTSTHASEVPEAVERAVRDLGYREDDDSGGEEATRQADLARLVVMAREYPGEGGIGGFVADLLSRFTQEADGRGVHLLTYHRAKGKEYEAVFLPRLETGELPFALAKTQERQAEERRLFYVGITRAKKYLYISWAWSRPGERRARREPSCFLREIAAGHEVSPSERITPSGTAGNRAPDKAGKDEHSRILNTDLGKELKRWRLQTARENALPAFVVCHDSTLSAIAEAKPKTLDQLRQVRGMGPAKVDSYGAAILDVVSAEGAKPKDSSAPGTP